MKYIITNNPSKLYNSREEAQQEFDKQLSQLSGFQKRTFKFLYTVAPFIE